MVRFGSWFTALQCIEDLRTNPVFIVDKMHGIDWDAYAFPTVDVDLDMNLRTIPETTINLQFDGLELYMLLDIALPPNQPQTIPLYPKSWYQPAGIAIGDQEIGIVISLDLILELDTEVNISTGVHVAFEDGLSIEISMFGTDVSTITL